MIKKEVEIWCFNENGNYREKKERRMQEETE
jgi:protocatechuate 3,4-dioxygenase beta subunit